MAYVNNSYYKDTFKGSIIPDEQLDQPLNAASDDIDALTFNRIGGDCGLLLLTPFQQEKIRRATCLQADFHHENDDMLNNPLSSYGINGVSMSFDNNKIICYSGIYTTSGIYALLRQTGLTYRGVML